MSSRRGDARVAVFMPQFLDDLRYLVSHDWRLASRLLDLVVEILRDPFRGIGKPEPLRHEAPDMWSRRLTAGDRVVYRVFDDRVEFWTGRSHY